LSIGFYTANSYSQYPQLQNDIKDAKANANTVDNIDEKVEKSIFGSLPPVRRVMSLPEKFTNGDTVAGIGLTAIAVANFPEDCRDIRAGFKQIGAKLNGQSYTPAYANSQFQHDFSFFKGTLFENWYKNTKNEKVKKTLDYLYEKDNSLYDTKFGDKVKKFLNITDGKTVESTVKNRFGEEMLVTEVKAGNAFSELTGRAMKRTTKLGIIALALLELPKIIKAMGKGDNISEQAGSTSKQLVKSGINLTTVTAGIAYGGAFGAKKFGAMGSLVGMGVGAVIGATASNKIQELIA